MKGGSPSWGLRFITPFWHVKESLIMLHFFPDKPGSSVSAPGSAPGSSDSFPQIGRVGPLKPQQILFLSLMTWLVLMVHAGLISSVFQLWLCSGRLPPLRAAGRCLVEKQLLQPLLVQLLLLSAHTLFNKCTFDLLFLLLFQMFMLFPGGHLLPPSSTFALLHVVFCCHGYSIVASD